MGAQVRKILRRYPRINGTSYDPTSLEVSINGEPVRGIRDLNYTVHRGDVTPNIRRDA